MGQYRKYAEIPLRQLPNRVWRSYCGGAMIDRWKNESVCEDGAMPEEWVASTVVARGDNRPADEGISMFALPDGRVVPLTELIADDREAFLGERIARTYGDVPLLTKLLDSCERLTIQVHPDKRFAADFLHSRFGKTEGWYVLGTRPVDGEESYVLFGFKEGVDRAKWRDLFLRQDISGMIGALHKVRVKPGDVFIINGGVPHAIGSGCFLLELQEPTDYTMRVEKTTPRGASLSGMLVHQGVGEERMLDCFHYDSLSLDETLRRWKIEPREEILADGSTLKHLIDRRHTDCFSLSELCIPTSATLPSEGDFRVVIVYRGSGLVRAGQYEMAVRQGDELFIPARVGDLEWRVDSAEPMRLLLCNPPR